LALIGINAHQGQVFLKTHIKDVLMKKVLALLALTTSFAAVAAPVAGHAGKASHKGANPAVAKTHGKALKGKAAKGKSVAQDAPQTMETAPAAVAPAPQQAAPAAKTAPQAPAAH
jgi:hypothetical protein